MAVMPVIDVVWCPNPLRPASDRQALTVALQPGDTAQDIVERAGLADTPLVLAVNGRTLPADRWSETVIEVSDFLVLQQVPKGVVEGSAVTAKLVMSANMAYGTAFVLGAAIAFAANVAIAYAVSTLAASMTRKKNSSSAADDSPTAYSVEGGSNSSRPYEPLPLVLGEHRFYPDYASRPFAEYVPDPTTSTEVINNTPVYEERVQPPFSLDNLGNPIAPWTLIAFSGSTEDGSLRRYFGDNASRTYSSSSGGTVNPPHTFVVREAQSMDLAVATYEDYLVLTGPGSGDGGSGGGDGPGDGGGDGGSSGGDGGDGGGDGGGM